MFFHGIDLKFFRVQYPLFFPDAHVSSKSKVQLEDRKHLIERFGFEPVHLLESSKEYPVGKCLEECFSFGEIVFVFRFLKGPTWQISNHEIAVRYLDVRQCDFIMVKRKEHREALLDYFQNKIIFLLKNDNSSCRMVYG